jgi:hypothetical protein
MIAGFCLYEVRTSSTRRGLKESDLRQTFWRRLLYRLTKPPFLPFYFNTDFKNAPTLCKEDRHIFYFRLLTLLPRDPCLFVEGFDPTPITKLPELNFALHQLLVLIGVIIAALADGATHRY